MLKNKQENICKTLARNYIGNELDIHAVFVAIDIAHRVLTFPDGTTIEHIRDWATVQYGSLARKNLSECDTDCTVCGR